MTRRLYRCRHDRKLAGVAAGMAEYFDLDPTLVRVIWFVSIFFGGFSILVYLALAFLIPLEPLGEGETEAALPVGHRHAGRRDGRLATFVGAVLILIGGVALLDLALPSWVDVGRWAWPVFLVGLGAILVVGALRREPSDL